MRQTLRSFGKCLASLFQWNARAGVKLARASAVLVVKGSSINVLPAHWKRQGKSSFSRLKSQANTRTPPRIFFAS